MVKIYILDRNKVVIKIWDFININLFMKILHKIINHDNANLILYLSVDFLFHSSLKRNNIIRIFIWHNIFLLTLFFNSQNSNNNSFTVNTNIIVSLRKIFTSQYTLTNTIWKLYLNSFLWWMVNNYFWFKKI